MAEFAAVGQNPEATFYELCYCLCTPATKARHALALVAALRRRNFYTTPLSLSELEQLLREPTAYIRFHRLKARRLYAVHTVFARVWDIRHSHCSPFEKRRQLVRLVNGFGMKEASHFLRNTGVRGIAVLDRHVVRWMHRLGYPVPMPKSPNSYEHAERIYAEMARALGLPLEELDLLLWSMETGEVLR